MISFLAKFDIHISEDITKKLNWLVFEKPHFLGIGTAVIALLISMTPNYTPLRQSMTLRYLETIGKAPWQIAAQQEAEKKAELSKSIQAEYRKLIDDYNKSFMEQSASQNNMVLMATVFRDEMQKKLKDPNTYKEKFNPELVSSRDSCFNKLRITYESEYINTKSNLFLCGFNVSLTSGNEKLLKASDITILLFVAKIESGEFGNEIKISDIILLNTFAYINNQLSNNNPVSEAPPLMNGLSYNSELLYNQINDDFVKLLLDNTSDTDKIDLRINGYPKIEAAHLAAMKLINFCKLHGFTPCVETIPTNIG